MAVAVASNNLNLFEARLLIGIKAVVTIGLLTAAASSNAEQSAAPRQACADDAAKVRER